MSALRTARLTLTPLAASDAGVFHALVTDPHVRRYLMDGEILSREWAEEQITASDARFAGGGLGLWLARRDGEPVGFCGFLALPGTGLQNELVYALREGSSGGGLGTELAAAMIAQARAQPGFGPIHASVDTANTASVRILEKLGFQLTATRPGAFGEMRIYRLDQGTLAP